MSKEAAEDFGKNAGEAFNKAVSTMANTAGTMAGAKMASDMTNIKQAEKVGGFIERSRTLAEIKSVSDNLEVQANKKFGYVDENGHVTQKGEKAFNINPETDKAKLNGMVKFMDNGAENFVQKAYDEIVLNKLAEDGVKLEDATKEQMEGAMSFAASKTRSYANFDEKGNFTGWKKGQDFLNAKAELSAGGMHSSNTMVLDGGGSFAGSADINTGEAGGKLSYGLNSAHDTTQTSSWGAVKNHDPFGDQLSKEQFEMYKYALAALTVGGVAGGIYAYGKDGVKTAEKGYRKFKGQEQGVDSKGNKEWHTTEKWEILESEGQATRTKNGWELNTTFDEADKFIKNYQPRSGPDLNNTNQTNFKTNAESPTATPVNTQVNMDTPPEKSSNNQIIPENQEGVNTKNNNFRQTAMDRYLTEKQTGLDLSNNKDLAEFNRLESYKGKDLDNLSDMEKNKLGLDSSAFSSAKLAILF